jgi:hypothetical protein
VAIPIDVYRERHPEAFSPWRSRWVLGGALAAILAAGGAFLFLKRRKA